MTKLFYLFFYLISTLAYDCSISDPSKIDCGYVGIDKSQCESKGCCWFASTSSGVPWCFNAKGASDTCSNLFFTATDPGFKDSDFQTMKSYFYKNLNIAGIGAVVASPDPNTPGGSYYYSWERDAALCMKSFMYINDNDMSAIQTYMDSYVNWVLHIHSLADPNNIDIRIEVKYNLPDGSVYTGGWCRPQTDAPGLRATTLSIYAQTLIKAGKTDFIKEKLWTGNQNYHGGAIKYDLDWIVDNWKQNSCDLWEEIRSDDLFWGRFTSRRGLLEGAKIADHFGDTTSSSKYRQAASDIEKTLQNHWTGSFIKESDNRPMDAAVISAFTDGYTDDEIFKPTDVQVANTIETLNNLFCHSYTINQIDIQKGIPGILYGRYQGDSYAGGNPWVLLSADLAKVYYRAAISIIDGKKQGITLNDKEVNAWMKAINIKEIQGGFLGDKDLQLASLLINAGDSVLQRIYTHVKDGGFHLAEQIDRNTGESKSAKDLSWSYATVLVAIKIRGQAKEKMSYLVA